MLQSFAKRETHVNTFFRKMRSGTLSMTYGSLALISQMANAREVLRQRVAQLMREHQPPLNNREIGLAVNKGDSWASEFLSGKGSIQWKDVAPLADLFGVPMSDLFREDLLEQEATASAIGKYSPDKAKLSRSDIVGNRVKPSSEPAPSGHSSATTKGQHADVESVPSASPLSKQERQRLRDISVRLHQESLRLADLAAGPRPGRRRDRGTA